MPHHRYLVPAEVMGRYKTKKISTLPPRDTYHHWVSKIHYFTLGHLALRRKNGAELWLSASLSVNKCTRIYFHSPSSIYIYTEEIPSSPALSAFLCRRTDAPSSPLTILVTLCWTLIPFYSQEYKGQLAAASKGRFC